MSAPCEQKDAINQIMGVVGALKDLPLAIQELRGDLKELMRAIQAASEDNREHKTLISQNRRDIETLRLTDDKQWTELEELAKRFSASCQRTGERIETIEKWQAGLNGGKPDGLTQKIDLLITEHHQHVGQIKLLLAIPTLISIATAIFAYIKLGAPH